MADLRHNDKVKKDCLVSILTQSWNEKDGKKGGQTQITCPEDKKSQTFSHKVAKRQIPGGSQAASNEESLAVLNKYLKEIKGGPEGLM